MLRQLLTVGILLGFMTMLQVMAVPTTGALNPVSMAAFGFIVLAAYTLGEMAGRIRLPHITGYLVTGLLCGPYVIGLLTADVVQDLRLFDALAVALIGMSAGGALKLSFLRKSARVVFSVMGAQFAVILTLVTALALLVAGPMDLLPLPESGGLTLTLVAALLLATIAAALSPAATIAVIHDTRARGPVSSGILGVSVLNNVVVVMLFALVVVAARHLLGEGGQDHVATVLLTRIGGSIALGVALGVVISLYLRFVRSELLLFVVGASFAVTFVANELTMDPVLTFIFAGFVVSNFCRQADLLLKVVVQVSRPVFVVFFFVAGAGLHLDALANMWPAALLLFVGRLASLYAGTRLGNTLARGPDGLGRFGWMGFGPQAGIALTLATVVGHTFHDWGSTVETLAVAGIALNELVGPALLQAALGLVQETNNAEEASAQREATEEHPRPEGAPDIPPDPGPGLPEWLPEPGRAHRQPWGSLPSSTDSRLHAIVDGLKEELLALVGDLRAGPVSQRREQAIRFLGLLRREFLRAHRHSYLAATNFDEDSEWRRVLRREHAELATRWERLLLDRAATVDFRQEIASLRGVVEAVDRLPGNLPEALEVPLEESWLQPHEGDPLYLAWMRRLYRGRVRLWQALGVHQSATRVVEIRALTHFHLSGWLPVFLLESAGLMAMSERHLLARARSIFDAYHQAMLHALQTDITFQQRRTTLDGMGQPDGLIDQDAVDLVHDGIVERSLGTLVEVHNHVVPQVIEAELVVGAISDLGLIRFATGDGP